MTEDKNNGNNNIAENPNLDAELKTRNADEQWAEKLGVTNNAQSRVTPPPVPSPEQPAAEPPAAGQGQQPPSPFRGFPLKNQPAEVTEPMPKTFLVWSILCTLLCCFIPGIVAIFFSSQVSSRYYAGDIEGARKSSRRAEIWIIVSFVLGMLSNTLYIPLMLVSGL